MEHHNKVLNARQLRMNRLVFFISSQLMLAGSIPLAVQARDTFNPALLERGPLQQNTTDLSLYEQGAGQPPGTYHVDIYLNNDLQDTGDVVFTLQKNEAGSETLQPCLSVAHLKAMGVKTQLYPALGEETTACAKLSAIAQASADFRFNTQQLLLSVPQVAVSQGVRGAVPEKQWDNGISALMLNYNLSGAHNESRSEKGQNTDTQYANLRPGINIGPWRLRNYTTWSRDAQGMDKWDTVYTYASRSIITLKSQLVLGDSSSPSDIFDGVPFRGGQLASDDDMVPDSMKGYAPVVRGIARTQAQVIIRQNGYIIYQSYVAPGAFEINDMYATGGSGDLYVTIKEADGSEQLLVIPYASLPVLQREGRVKYSITGGQYRSYDSHVDKTPFSQATVIYGLPQGLTLYGGGQLSSPYQSLSAGIGKNLGTLGALSSDLTQAWSAMQDQAKETGQSWRIRYSKNIVQTGTNFAIAGYRYSTDGYFNLQEVMDTYRGNTNVTVTERRRNRSEMSVSQNLGENHGSLSLNWASEDYWNSDQALRTVGVSYNNSWNGISYGVNYSYSENSGNRGRNDQSKTYQRDQIFGVNISVPFSVFLPQNTMSRTTNASYSMNTSKHGNTTNSVGLSGSTLEDNNLNWSVQQGYGSQDTGNSGNVNADYRGTYNEVTAGYAYDRHSERLNYGLQGGIIAHKDGVTFGQSMGETPVLVKAPGASNVAVGNQNGVRTDWRGYAIVPYSTPYRRNTIQLVTETLPENVELKLTNQNVVPTRGAIARASFITSVGERVMMTILRRGGIPVPFGATVTDPELKTEDSFIVGDAGQVYLTGLANQGTLNVKWGSDAAQQCQVKYALARQPSEQSGVQTMNGECH
ncbi:fimbria/pilus outer membrane usher protein [Rahnella bonaserana]|jgi:outer membrane usher protein